MRPMNRKMEMEREGKEEKQRETVNLKSSSIQPISTISFPITNYLFQQTNINYDRICAINIIEFIPILMVKFSLFVPMLLFCVTKTKQFFPLDFRLFFGAKFFACTIYFVGTIKSKQSKVNHNNTNQSKVIKFMAIFS